MRDYASHGAAYLSWYDTSFTQDEVNPTENPHAGDWHRGAQQPQNIVETAWKIRDRPGLRVPSVTFAIVWISSLFNALF